MQSIETVIVGGGQAGLSTSYYLGQAGREHLVLEQAETAADAWRSQRWDSFRLVTPNWGFRLPGAEYDGPEPDAFMPLDEVRDRFQCYVETFQLPVRTHTRVTSIEAGGAADYRVATSNGDFLARNVVIATGATHLPRIPKDATAIASDILQFHSSAYRKPEALPPARCWWLAALSPERRLRKSFLRVDARSFTRSAPPAAPPGAIAEKTSSTGCSMSFISSIFRRRRSLCHTIGSHRRM